MDKHSYDRETFLPPASGQRDNVKQSYHKAHSTGHASYDKPREVYPGRQIVAYSPPNDMCVYSLDDHHQPTTSSYLPHTARQHGELFSQNRQVIIERYRYEQLYKCWISHLILSIFVIIFCAWPCGFAAFVKAFKIRIYSNEGRYQEAESYVKEAGRCSIIGIACGILCYLALGLYIFLQSKQS
ncbi:unnamed protein product [Lymnaea stagnalis]|uniref:Uncharacterized protein n=1 Tax=Lymnaea stagnalis TaxID=6523 RepID=A0AAV2H974_LYMST